MELSLNDFKRDTCTMGYIPEHVRAFSGRSSVGRVPGTVTGIERIFAPPFAAGDYSMTVEFEIVSHHLYATDQGKEGHGLQEQLLLQAEWWHPSYIYRRGKIHHHTEDCCVSLFVDTWVIPSCLDDSVFLKLKIENRGDSFVEINLMPIIKSIRFGIGNNTDWAWSPPEIEAPAQKVADGMYKGQDANMGLQWSSESNFSDGMSVGITPSSFKEVGLKLSFYKLESAKAPEISYDILGEIESSLEEREKEWGLFWSKVPHLNTDHAELQNAYNHSILTFFLCKWNSPHFLINPHYATSGINGGALCNYLWSEAYCSDILAIVEGADWKSSLITHLKMGFYKHYAFEPLSGKGVGPFYSYNAFSICKAIDSYIKWTGDRTILQEDINGQALYKSLIYQIELFESMFEQYDGLIDFKDHHHLLEMRTSGYEHIVPSPNGERIILYNALSEMMQGIDEEKAMFYRRKAAKVKESIINILWDEQEKWFKCLYPYGKSEIVMSVQIFDLLGLGILGKSEEEALLDRINDDEFLSIYGLHSVSKMDEIHFDLGDVDWSGPGCYSGDPSNLIEILFKMGKADLAWDVMKRILWWSEKYPYWPQCICANKQDYSHWEQPICHSALAFAQAIVFGMFGLKLENGTPVFEPKIPKDIGKVRISNVIVFADRVNDQHGG